MCPAAERSARVRRMRDPFRTGAEGQVPGGLEESVKEVASRGATPLVVAEGNEIAGLVVLEDILKLGIQDRFARLRRMACAR